LVVLEAKINIAAREQESILSYRQLGLVSPVTKNRRVLPLARAQDIICISIIISASDTPLSPTSALPSGPIMSSTASESCGLESPVKAGSNAETDLSDLSATGLVAIVVGASFSGLATAVALHSLGCEVQLYEQGDGIGPSSEAGVPVTEQIQSFLQTYSCDIVSVTPASLGTPKPLRALPAPLVLIPITCVALAEGEPHPISWAPGPQH
jgi:hypothetical protein